MKPQTHRYKEIAREQMADRRARGFLDLLRALAEKRKAAYEDFPRSGCGARVQQSRARGSRGAPAAAVGAI